MITARIRGSVALLDCSLRKAKELERFFSIPLPPQRLSYRQRWLINTCKYCRKSLLRCSCGRKQPFWDGKYKIFTRKSKRLPVGLLGLVEQYIGEVYRLGDVEEAPELKWILRKTEERKHLKLKDEKGIIKLQKFQKPAVQRAIENLIGIVKVATNGGKTEIAAAILKLIRLRTLYLVHRKELLHQTADRLQLRLGEKVGRWGDSVKKIRRITVAMVQSLPPPTKPNKDFYEQFRMLIVDEAHHTSATTWYKIAMSRWAKWRRKYSLSGTPFTGNPFKDIKFVGVFGNKLLANVRNERLIKIGWSARPSVNIWPVYTMGYGLSWRTAYQQLIVDNPEYNELVINLARKSWEKGWPTLILVNHIKHGVRLYRRLSSEKIDCRFLSGGTNSYFRKKTLKQFRKGKIGVLIATTIFDEGVDVPAIKTLILAGGGKAPIALLQRVGRALRKKKTGDNVAVIHDFHHHHNETLNRHSLQRLGIFEDEDFFIRTHTKDEAETLEKNPKAWAKTWTIDWDKFHKEESK